MTKLLPLSVLFSTAVITVVADKLVILGVLFQTSFILELREVVVVVAKSVILVVLPVTYLSS